MSRKLLTFIRIAEGKTYADAQAHETRVGHWLKRAGFKAKDIKYQPYGSTNPPDWLVKINGKWTEIECKTSLKSRASFGDTPPNKDTLFVFSSKSHNDTMVFYGGDIYKQATRKLIDDYTIKVKTLEKKYGILCTQSKRTNPFGIIPGFRLRLRQRGGMKVTDFFGPGIRESLVKKAKQRHI
jgi:hypothetical protein